MTTRLALALIGAGAAGVALAEPMTVPFDAHYEPMSFRGEDGSAQGFDVAVAQALADRAGIEISFQPTDFFDIQLGGWPADWGYAVASMSRDPDREARFEFVGPYLYDTVVVVASDASQVSDVGDLRDIPIGVCSGCVYEDFLNGNAIGIDGQPIPGASVVNFMTDPDILREVASPSSDLSFGITSAFHADYYITLGFPLKKLSPPLFLSPLWIAVPKDETELKDRIDAAFAEMVADGTLSDLSRTHLQHDYTTIAP